MEKITREISQADLMRAGFVRLVDDYDKSSVTKDTYDVWHETWEKKLTVECSLIYTSSRVYQDLDNTWELVEENLELWIDSSNTLVRKDLGIVEQMKNILLP